MAVFHYFADDELSESELLAATIDGHLIAYGAGFVPADIADTAWMRARALRPVLGDTLAAVRLTAAWVHGWISVAPVRHDVQRATERRLHRMPDRALDYHDLRLAVADTISIAHVSVSSQTRTVVDLARTGAQHELIANVLAAAPELRASATQWLTDHPRFPGARAARSVLTTTR